MITRRWLTAFLVAIAALLTAPLAARAHVAVTGLAQITIADAHIGYELSLALPEFPRLADAVVDHAETADLQPGGFTALERLLRPLRS